MARHLLARLQLGATTIGGLTLGALSESLQEMVDAGGSELDPSKIAINSIEPLFTFSTYDVKALFDLLYGNPVSNAIPHFAATGGTTIKWTLADAAEGGTRGANERTYTVNKGILVPLRIYGGPTARVDCAVLAVYDGTNLPVLRSSQAIGATAPAQLWRLCGIREGATILQSIMDWSIDFGIDVRTLTPTCSQYPRMSGVFGFAPTARFQTRDVGTALGLVASGGAIVGNPVGGSALEFVLAPYTTAGLVDGTTDAGVAFQFHTGGLWFPTSIDLPAAGHCALEMGVVGIGASSGLATTDSPLTFDRTSTPDAETGAAVQYMTGPQKHNTTIIEVASGGFDFGLELQPTTPAHQPWPTSVFIRRRGSRARYRMLDAEAYNAIFLTANTLVQTISTGWHIYLRKVTSEGLPVIDATAAHVKLSISAGEILGRSIPGEHNAISQPEIEVVARAALSVATASAIT